MILDEVREAAMKKILFLPHATRPMSRPDCMITPKEVEYVVVNGNLFEDYPLDLRGHSCLR